MAKIKKKKSPPKQQDDNRKHGIANYPRLTLEKALRIPKAIVEQNAGKDCTEEQAATFINVKSSSGPFQSELRSAIKFGLLEKKENQLILTEIGKKIFRPQASSDHEAGLRAAILAAPQISDVYNHFRGENLPDPQFLDNSLVDNFKIPSDKVGEFRSIFISSLKFANLLEDHGDKTRLVDVVKSTSNEDQDKSNRLKKLEKGIDISNDDTCFVMMPFALPIGGYYSSIYEPAIRKAGLTPVRADDDIFTTGQIIDQVWSGISSAKVLVAELTDRNANVFYELGLAHASMKPVVLIASKEEDVPFDIRHIRVTTIRMIPFGGRN